jgi:hypothetical protein
MYFIVHTTPEPLCVMFYTHLSVQTKLLWCFIYLSVHTLLFRQNVYGVGCLSVPTIRFRQDVFGVGCLSVHTSMLRQDVCGIGGLNIETRRDVRRPVLYIYLGVETFTRCTAPSL